MIDSHALVSLSLEWAFRLKRLINYQKLIATILRIVSLGLKMNRWSIPKLLEDEIKSRDKTCVYCGVKLLEVAPPGSSRKAKATWEHIINDAHIITHDNIARCCAACNSSKGTKRLSDWIKSNYCKERGINRNTVAPIVKKALRCG